jgi:hypothetical protein
VELTCPECLDELDQYTQSTLDGTPIDGLLERVQEHLEACPVAPVSSSWCWKR